MLARGGSHNNQTQENSHEYQYHNRPRPRQQESQGRRTRPDGKQLFREEVSNTPESVRTFFEAHQGATVGMETGTHVRWIAALARECGCRPVVGNAASSV